MNKVLYTIVTIFVSVQVSFAAMSGGSSSSSSSSSTSYSSSSSNDSGGYSQTNRFKDINKLIKLEKFAEAHKLLKNLKKVNTDEADRLNLLGFTARKSGDLATAGDYYKQALALNPKHTGALEYQGELFIQRAIYYFLEFVESKVTFDFFVKNLDFSMIFDQQHSQK